VQLSCVLIEHDAYAQKALVALFELSAPTRMDDAGLWIETLSSCTQAVTAQKLLSADGMKKREGVVETFV
jgi:hypothetical protein